MKSRCWYSYGFIDMLNYMFIAISYIIMGEHLQDATIAVIKLTQNTVN